MRTRAIGLSLYGSLAASTRYRLEQYIPGLSARGVDLDVRSLLGDEYVRMSYAGQRYPLHCLARDYLRRAATLLADQHRYDLAIVNVELFPLLPGLIESRLLRIPYIYDFDDAFFLKYRLERFRRVSCLLGDKFAPVVARAAVVTAGNRYLANYALQHNARTRVLPTVVDTTRYVPRPAKRADVFTVGWIGSPSTSIYLNDLKSILATLAAEGPLRFVAVGGRAPSVPGVEVESLTWSEATEVDLINTFDVGVMPLFDDEWARGKCAFKLIQYMACGVPVVASAIGANNDVVTPDTGLLVSAEKQWLDALRRLRDHHALRAEMGRAGRARIERHYSLESGLPIMFDAIEDVLGMRR